MREFLLPTAAFESFTTIKKAEEFIRASNWKVFVVKADGLAAGKGVVVARSTGEAIEAARTMLEVYFPLK